MRDLHSHYLPGVDDGAKNIDMTKRMLENAYNNGVTDIVFTPHYIEDSRYSSNYNNNYKIFEEIRDYAKNEYNMNLFLGNEVFFTPNIYELYKRGEFTTINNSKYMLLEIPLNTRVNNVKSVFIELINEGIIPILAHPERYTPYYMDLDFFISLKKLGVLMQINAPSLVGEYGRRAKKMAILLLKNNLVSFVGTDIHSDVEDKNDCLNKALKKIKKLVSYDDYLDITMNNFARVISNEDID